MRRSASGKFWISLIASPPRSLPGMVPKLRYRHPHNPAHAPDYIISSILGVSLCLPFADGALVLGTWQRVVLVELDGPRERRVTVTLLGELTETNEVGT